MSKLRGDNDLLSLMDEMSSQQGYDNEKRSAANTDKNNRKTRCIRLTEEVADYPSDKGAGDELIWNPYVPVSATPCGACCFAPSNPHVEVFRRRAYERFKGEFRAIFERTSANANSWAKLSVPSLMERWHFDAKLNEFFMLQHLPALPRSNNNNTLPTTSEIKSILSQCSNYALMDPILIGTDSPSNHRKRASNDTATNVPSASTLLADEIKFEWMRTDKSTDDSFFEFKGFRKKVSKISRAVMDAAATVQTSFSAEVHKRAALEANQSSKRGKTSVPKITHGEDCVHVTFSGLSFRLSMEHYHKLQILYDRSNSGGVDRVTHESRFAASLFTLLARYDMLQGAGLQSSMPGAVFDLLLKNFDCRLECFASPLNCRYEHYCSAFYDTDAPFGSVGSFFHYNFKQGCYQANPPFSANFIAKMYEYMRKALNQATTLPLMFCVFVPA